MPAKPKQSWINLTGTFDQTDDEIIFRGYDFVPVPLSRVSKATDDKGLDESAVERPQPPSEPRGGVGQCMSNQRFTEGSVSVDITFDDIDPNSTAELILDYDPNSGDMLNAGIGAGSFLAIRLWTQAPPEQSDKASTGPSELPLAQRWVYLRQAGDLSNLTAGRTYQLEVDVRGSLLTVLVDGVEILSGNLRFPLVGRQLGFFCQNRKDVHFKNLEVKTKRPMAFVVMQLNPPEYEELFHKVIVPVCERMGLEAFRASQTFEPGLIIADIQRKIRQSRVVIAEISPVNANVYYEVGFADAIGKPLILVADGAKVELLPFDVRGFRTIFYKDTIGGKERVEDTLTEYLRNILGRRG
jgi:hypothetical protein